MVFGTDIYTVKKNHVADTVRSARYQFTKCTRDPIDLIHNTTGSKNVHLVASKAIASRYNLTNKQYLYRSLENIRYCSSHRKKRVKISFVTVTLFSILPSFHRIPIQV